MTAPFGKAGAGSAPVPSGTGSVVTPSGPASFTVAPTPSIHAVPLRPGDPGLDHDAVVGRGRLHGADGAVAHTEVHDEPVVRAHGGPVDDVDQVGADAGELPEGDADLVDELRPVRPQPPTPPRRVGPPGWHHRIGVGEHGNVHEPRRQAGLADVAAPYGLRQAGLAGVEAELGPEQVHDPGGFRRRQELPTLRQRRRERLLTQDVSPGGDRFQRQRGVRPRRRRHGDTLDTGQGQRVAEREQRAGHLEEPRPFGRLVRILPHEGEHVEPHCTQCAYMGVATEPRPHHGDPGHDTAASASTARVASAASRAAAAAPLACRSSEKTSMPMGARCANRPERPQVADEVEGTLAREEPVVQRRVHEIRLGLRRTVVHLHGQHECPGHPQQVLGAGARTGAVPHVDGEAAVGAAGQGHHLERRREVGDARPGQPFQVDQQPVLRRVVAQAREGGCRPVDAPVAPQDVDGIE